MLTKHQHCQIQMTQSFQIDSICSAAPKHRVSVGQTQTKKKERNPNSRKKKRSPSARHSIAYLFQMISRTRGYFFRWISVSKKPKLKRTPTKQRSHVLVVSSSPFRRPFPNNWPIICDLSHNSSVDSSRIQFDLQPTKLRPKCCVYYVHAIRSELLVNVMQSPSHCVRRVMLNCLPIFICLSRTMAGTRPFNCWIFPTRRTAPAINSFSFYMTK